jgi:hypothetical protein
MPRLVPALLAVAMLAQAAQAQTVACDLKLNVVDPDPAGLNVRSSPGGAIVTALKANDRWVEVHVIGDSGAWAQIDGATLYTEDNAGGSPLYQGRGWVAFSKLGFNEFDEHVRIFATPSDDARVLLKLHTPDGTKQPKADLLGCSGDYLHIRIGAVVGWTRDYCDNQFTTCV